MERLRPDDRTLWECVSEYSCLLDSQLRRYLKILRDKANYDIALRNLRIRQYVFCGDTYVAIEPNSRSDPKMLMAFDVLLWFMSSDPGIHQNAHCRGRYPAQILFMRNYDEYQIIVLEKETDIFLLNYINAEDLDIRYIWVVPDKEYIGLIHQKTEKLHLKNKFLFAMHNQEDENVEFFTYFPEVKN